MKDMNEEIIAAIVMYVIGFCLLFVPSNKIWYITEKWKTAGGEGPSKSFVVITRILGIVFVAAGCYLLLN